MASSLHPFQKPTTPKNSLELFKWLIFEPVILEKFSKRLSKTQTFSWLLRAYLWIVVFATLLYLLILLIIVWINLPTHFPSTYQPGFLIQWQNNSAFVARYSFLLHETALLFFGSLIWWLAWGLAGGLAGGLARGVALWLAGGLALWLLWGLVLWLTGGLAWGLAWGLTGRLAGGLALGLALGLTWGLTWGLAWGLAWELAWGLAWGLVWGLALGLAWGLAWGVGLLIGFYLIYFRFLSYPYHVLKILFPIDFHHNPYLQDGVICLPLPIVKKKLTYLAFQHPDIALDFVNFLLEYRPLQRKLAMHILHVAIAGHWAHSPLDADKLLPPNVDQNLQAFVPSNYWVQQLADLKRQLISSQKQNNIGLRKNEFEQFFTKLTKFREQTLLEPSLWNAYYLEALDQWIIVAQEERDKLDLEAKIREPISSNGYRPGEALRPDSQNVFFGREDLREDLTRRILTSHSMPLFLIQGQRRVGKTSLLNFLPQLLSSRFKLIYQDCQDDRVRGVIPWLQDLRQRLQKQLNLSEENWSPQESWLAAWGEFRDYLTRLSEKEDRKLILALDEYEQLHRFFQKNVEEAENLLAAMRSFSQHQNQIVFLFVGAHLFSDLQKPNWSHYFVQTERLKVDYLKKYDALRLITEPVQLRYPPALPEQMFELTQGHPALLQKLCREMVDIANTDLRRDMTSQDLDKAVKATLDRENLVFSIFWTEFCEDPACKTTVKRILAHQVPTDRYQLLRLEEHGYILQEADSWKLRVPLFERWLERYADALR